MLREGKREPEHRDSKMASPLLPVPRPRPHLAYIHFDFTMRNAITSSRVSDLEPVTLLRASRRPLTTGDNVRDQLLHVLNDTRGETCSIRVELKIIDRHGQDLSSSSPKLTAFDD
ncbi:hypothetical protein EVAR_9138_1 [Eumeta japonica]|uniref:Uncharacterized protein n=1 Tax=Eumeta variegata TaxID=151549 RepID=A0A4C1TWN7_EUMVA|nr:hypothetical protein EVAR_9138_1 [Eumeta japonica]